MALINHIFILGNLFKSEIPEDVRKEVIVFIQGPASAGVEDEDSMVPSNYGDALAQAEEDGETPSPAAKKYLDALVAEAVSRNIGEIVICSGKPPKN